MLSSRLYHSQCLISDYITLVRTRIKDLGGLSLESPHLASGLVREAVNEFKHSGRILPKVLEASIFRAPFYVGSFLPFLLSMSEEEIVAKALIRELNRYILLVYLCLSSSLFQDRGEFQRSCTMITVLGMKAKVLCSVNDV